jgi:4-methyl-5(b-hydroxyethyl)-thiazole monophosphate biosynthesis
MSAAAETPVRVLVPLAEGFEEIEAVVIVDVLRRAGVEVVLASLAESGGLVRGAHGIALQADAALGAQRALDYDAIVLPGGMPGSAHLAQDERVLRLLREAHGGGKRVAAICAAPSVLARAGLLEGVPATAYPAFQDKLAGAHVRAHERVVRAGRILTSQGVGSALEFALALVTELVGAQRAAELARAMVVEPAAARA